MLDKINDKGEDTAHKGMLVATSNQSVIRKITFIHNILKREEIEVVLSPLVALLHTTHTAVYSW